MKYMKLDDLQEIARLATKSALADYTIPENWNDVGLETGWSDDGQFVSFELCVAGDRPIDSIVLVQIVVDRKTGDVGRIILSNMSLNLDEKRINARRRRFLGLRGVEFDAFVTALEQLLTKNETSMTCPRCNGPVVLDKVGDFYEVICVDEDLAAFECRLFDERAKDVLLQ